MGDHVRKKLPNRRRDYTGALIVALLFIVVMYVFDLPKQESLITLAIVIVISVMMREVTHLFHNERND
jgi:1,4-dihydroxy-2-naphthoate octaprenyltransferase